MGDGEGYRPHQPDPASFSGGAYPPLSGFGFGGPLDGRYPYPPEFRGPALYPPAAFSVPGYPPLPSGSIRLAFPSWQTLGDLIRENEILKRQISDLTREKATWSTSTEQLRAHLIQALQRYDDASAAQRLAEVKWQAAKAELTGLFEANNMMDEKIKTLVEENSYLKEQILILTNQIQQMQSIHTSKMEELRQQHRQETRLLDNRVKQLEEEKEANRLLDESADWVNLFYGLVLDEYNSTHNTGFRNWGALMDYVHDQSGIPRKPQKQWVKQTMERKQQRQAEVDVVAESLGLPLDEWIKVRECKGKRNDERHFDAEDLHSEAGQAIINDFAKPNLPQKLVPYAPGFIKMMNLLIEWLNE